MPIKKNAIKGDLKQDETCLFINYRIRKEIKSCVIEGWEILPNPYTYQESVEETPKEEMKYIIKKKWTSEKREKMGLARESGDNKCGCFCNNAIGERDMIKAYY